MRAYHTDSGLPGFRYSNSVASLWQVGKDGGQRRGKEIFVIIFVCASFVEMEQTKTSYWMSYSGILSIMNYGDVLLNHAHWRKWSTHHPLLGNCGPGPANKRRFRVSLEE